MASGFSYSAARKYCCASACLPRFARKSAQRRQRSPVAQPLRLSHLQRLHGNFEPAHVEGYAAKLRGDLAIVRVGAIGRHQHLERPLARTDGLQCRGVAERGFCILGLLGIGGGPLRDRPDSVGRAELRLAGEAGEGAGLRAAASHRRNRRGGKKHKRHPSAREGWRVRGVSHYLTNPYLAGCKTPSIPASLL